MTTRADLIETAANALHAQRYGWDLTDEDGDIDDLYREEAAAVLDAVLPQITTAEQVLALSDDAVVVGGNGTMARFQDGVLYGEGDDSWYAEDALEEFGPLTVVWRPQPEQETRADA